MKFDQPLYWRQGMFLQPHHFQHMDQHHYQMTQRHFAMSNPHSWGFNQLTIDEPSVANVVIDITSFEAIFPDGTYARYPGNAHVSTQSFETEWQDRSKPINLYLAIHKFDSSQANVGNESSADQPRFRSQEDETFNDIFDGKAEVEGSTLQYQCSIISSHELSRFNQHSILPLAEIVQGNEAAQLSLRFAPPSLSVAASTSMVASARMIKEEVVKRSSILEEYKGQSTNRAEFSQKVMRYRLALQVLSRYALWLQNIIETLEIHPWELFNVYSQLVGELSAFSVEYNALGERKDGTFPRVEYKHDNLGNTFHNMQILIINLLNEISVRPDLLVELIRQEGNVFSNEIPENFFASNRDFYLVLKTQQSIEPLLNSFNGFAKIGSQSQVQEMVNRALPGVSTNFVTVHPEGVPRFPDSSYFFIDKKCDEWLSVREQKDLSMMWQDAPSDLTVQLVVVGGD